jgi:hypothetical protein
MGHKRKGIVQDVINYVRRHPGAETQEVFDALPNADKIGTVQNTLARLAREGVLQNRGGNVNRFDPAKWYPNDPFISKQAQALARDIYAGMMKQHRSVREQFLADKLDDLLYQIRQGEV